MFPQSFPVSFLCSESGVSAALRALFENIPKGLELLRFEGAIPQEFKLRRNRKRLREVMATSLLNRLIKDQQSLFRTEINM